MEEGTRTLRGVCEHLRGLEMLLCHGLRIVVTAKREDDLVVVVVVVVVSMTNRGRGRVRSTSMAVSSALPSPWEKQCGATWRRWISKLRCRRMLCDG